MTDKIYRFLLLATALLFIVFFAATVVPPLVSQPDVIGAFAAGFVNPYAAGYSTDVILCWVTLAIWVVYERSTLSISGGWICLLLGIVPGVVVGMALYLVLRQRQLFSSQA